MNKIDWSEWDEIFMIIFMVMLTALSTSMLIDYFKESDDSPTPPTKVHYIAPDRGYLNVWYRIVQTDDKECSAGISLTSDENQTINHICLEETTHVQSPQ